MVTKFSSALLVLATTCAVAGASEWKKDYGKALAATRADSRPLLIVLDDPSDPNAAVSEDQLQPAGEQKELLASYERCHVDISTEYGKRVADAFKAKEFPFAAIIDKTGSVVLHKTAGKISDAEWEKTLATYQAGERSSTISHATFYRGEMGVNTSVVSPSYCPSCQRRAQMGF